MRKSLKDDIIHACAGWEGEHVSKVLRELLIESNTSQIRNMFNMNPCPRCGSTNVHITDVMQRKNSGEILVVAKMGFCTACKFHSKKVFAHDLRRPYTEASWTNETVNVWNNTQVTSMFGVCEDTFGEEYQYACNSEEVFELIESLTRYGKLTARDRRSDRKQSDESIVSEMADVIICIYQLLYTRKVSAEVLDKVMLYKVERTCANESVRTAIAELSKRVMEKTTITNVSSVEEDSQKTQWQSI